MNETYAANDTVESAAGFQVLRPRCFWVLCFGLTLWTGHQSLAKVGDDPAIVELKTGWEHPSRSCRPHTRWWWPGSAVTPDGIDWQLDQMRAQGIGGVEIAFVWEMYEKGNLPFLSQEWLDVLRHTVRAASERDMEVAITFGPGVVLGGFWIPPEDRSKVLSKAEVDIAGSKVFDDRLPEFDRTPAQHITISAAPPEAKDDGKLVAVVAARRTAGGLDGDSLTVLTSHVKGDRLRWQVPEGDWKLMVFRLNYSNQQCYFLNEPRDFWVVDHLSKPAMRRYCDHLGGALYRALGKEFGKTIDSLFSDSFEVKPLVNSVVWTGGVLEGFRDAKGYDFAQYLPAIWYDLGDVTPRVRYDLNEYLHQLGKSAFFDTLIQWCESHRVAARIQPHDAFPVEVIEGSGRTTRAETECSIPYFEVATFPHKSSAAGVRFYRGGFVSAEAYTHLHYKQRYLTTLHEMKLVTDQMLRDGVSQFYNHGYFYTPETDLAPSRDVPFGNLISHRECWWKYYGELATYVARCCQMMRQGHTVSSILVYSPQAQEWTERGDWGGDWRIIGYGSLGKTLVANGYDFDPVNDERLQNAARIHKGHLEINHFPYKLIIIQNIERMPVKTLRVMRDFVEQGGALIALTQLPSSSVGLTNWKADDEEVKQIVAQLFGTNRQGRSYANGGRTYYVDGYEVGHMETHPSEKAHAYRPTPPLTPSGEKLIANIRNHLHADFQLPNSVQSDGLTFLHRRAGSVDYYFVANMQPVAATGPIQFGVKDKLPERWNPMNGNISTVHRYRKLAYGTEVCLNLPPYESTFIVFRPGEPQLHVVETNLDDVFTLDANAVTGATSRRQTLNVVVEGKHKLAGSLQVAELPDSRELVGPWILTLDDDEPRQLSTPQPWTDNRTIRTYSGTGRYRTTFEIPADALKPHFKWLLDLGDVGQVAEVFVNDLPAGIRFQHPYAVDISPYLREGTNQLDVLVTNTRINQVSVMKYDPPLPAEMHAHYGTEPKAEPIKRGEMIAKFSYEQGYKPLPMSGLKGPVRLIPSAIVTIPLKPSE